MKLKLKNKHKNKESRGPTRNQTWGILKYLPAEIFTQKSKID